MYWKSSLQNAGLFCFGLYVLNIFSAQEVSTWSLQLYGVLYVINV